MILPVIFLAFLISSGASLVSASEIQGSFEILHIPRKSSIKGEPVTIEVSVTQPHLVRKAELRWRSSDKTTGTEYHANPMEQEGDYLVSQFLPEKLDKDSSPSRIEYYIWMVSTTGEVQTLPDENPGVFPYVIEILPSWLEILTPAPEEVVESPMPEIAGLFSPPVLPEKITIFLDSHSIEVEIIRPHGSEDATGFIILPQEPLEPGTHIVTVEKEGEEEISWSFEILAKSKSEQQVPKDNFVHGSISPAFQYASKAAKGDESLLPFPEGDFFLFDGYGVGRFQNLSFYGWVSRDPTYGDLLRFGGELTMEELFLSQKELNLTLGFGDLYPNFSRLTLSGISPRGFETKFSYSGWNLSVVALRTQQADSLVTDFDQFLLGAKATLLPFENFTSSPLKDFILTTTVLSGWDDSTSQEVSLAAIPEGNRLYALGFQMDLTHQFRIRGEYAQSHLEQDELISPGSDPVKDKAYEIEASYRGFPVDISLQYEEIGKDYFSFGNPYIETGRKGPSLYLDWAATQLTMRGGYGRFLSDGSTEPAWNRLNGRFQFAAQDNTDLYLLLNWLDKEPQYNSKSVTGGFILNVPPLRFKGSHTEVWTDFTTKTRTKMESGGVEWRTLKDRLSTFFEFQSNRSKSTNALLDQVRNMPRVVIEYRPTFRDQFQLRGSWIDQKDSVVPASSYDQQVIRFIYTRRF
jgi:hypothetical protein